MQIRLLTSIAGPAQAWAAGDLYECDEATARRMFAAGYAVPLDAGPAAIVVESATQGGGVERAIKPRARRRP